VPEHNQNSRTNQLVSVTRKKITNKKCTFRQLTDVTDRKSRIRFGNKKFLPRES